MTPEAARPGGHRVTPAGSAGWCGTGPELPAERGEAAQQDVGDDAGRPDVHLQAVPVEAESEASDLPDGHGRYGVLSKRHGQSYADEQE